MPRYLLSTIVASALFFSPHVQSQEFRAAVSVNVDQLPINQRDDIATMQNDVNTYYQSQRFTGSDWEGARIPLDVTIYITAGNQQARRYQARLFYNMRTNCDNGMTSPLLKVLDKDWVFSYTLNQQLNYQNLKFEEFSTVLDVYNFISLGLDADCFEQLSGTKYYQQARDIVQLGAGNNAAGYAVTVQQPGEFTRISLVSELLDQRMEEFRKLMFDYHADGIGVYGKDKVAGARGLENVLERMAEFKQKKLTQRSYFMQMFFDAKLAELTEIFGGSQNTEVLKSLRTLDPSNYSVYEQAIKK